MNEDGLETLYEYNLAGKLAQIAYADGKTVKLSYNLLGHLTEMQDWLGTTTTEVDELGQREKTIYPDESEVLYHWKHNKGVIFIYFIHIFVRLGFWVIVFLAVAQCLNNSRFGKKN